MTARWRLGARLGSKTNNGFMERRAVEQWVVRYELAWRTPGTGQLVELFEPDATYLPSPWARHLDGLDEIAQFWESERDGAEDVFSMASEVVAVDGDTAVVRVSVDYASSSAGRWRDLWVLRFAAGGRCSSFEEWPFAPNQPDGHQPGCAGGAAAQDRGANQNETPPLLRCFRW